MSDNALAEEVFKFKRIIIHSLHHKITKHQLERQLNLALVIILNLQQVPIGQAAAQGI
jgi:hypothetical protein